MKNKRTLRDISNGTDNQVLQKIKERNANRKLIRTQGRIALAILLRLEELDMTQTDLANKLGVSRQYVSKLVKGKEKFNSDILVKLEEILVMPIFVQNLPQEKQQLLKEQLWITSKHHEEIEITDEVLINQIGMFSLFNKSSDEAKIMEFHFHSNELINSKSYC